VGISGLWVVVISIVHTHTSEVVRDLFAELSTQCRILVEMRWMGQVGLGRGRHFADFEDDMRSANS
jgi:hypothetical protein